MRTATTLPAQSACARPTVSVNVSQLTPSVHVASLADAPPVIGPSHASGVVSPGPIVPEGGFAAFELASGSTTAANTGTTRRMLLTRLEARAVTRCLRFL